MNKLFAEQNSALISNMKSSCAVCGLYITCKSARMQPYGSFKKGILNIGEAPGETEDAYGKPWQGRTGKLLEKMYAKLGINLWDDCLNINAVSCMPYDKREGLRPPTNKEIEYCRKNVFKIIHEKKPKLIVLFGNSALYSVIGFNWKHSLEGISKWRGWTIPDQKFKAWICPVFHPSFIERTDSNATEKIWMDDLARAFSLLERDIPPVLSPKIDVVEDLHVLDTIKSGTVAIDYETTGIKPHASGHRIICASVADSENHAYVFLMPKTRKEIHPFLNLLENDAVEKIAHNMKYEDMWSAVRLKVNVKNWGWDTMIASHILDNRPGITSLKFQVYVQFGVMNYEENVSSYLQAKESKNSNSINNISTLLETIDGKNELLKYCALDAIYTFNLAKIQREIIFKDVLPF